MSHLIGSFLTFRFLFNDDEGVFRFENLPRISIVLPVMAWGLIHEGKVYNSTLRRGQVSLFLGLGNGCTCNCGLGKFSLVVICGS